MCYMQPCEEVSCTRTVHGCICAQMIESFSHKQWCKTGRCIITYTLWHVHMLSRLKQSGYGCMVGHLFCGALGHADDVSILAPSLYALR